MPRLQVPFIEEGDVLTDVHLTDFLTDATTARTGLDENNLAGQSVGRLQYDSTNGILLRFGAGSNSGANASYSTLATISHGAGDTSVTFSPAVVHDQAVFVVASLACLVGELTLDSAGYVNDQYKFQLVYTNNGVTANLGPAWTYSMLVRNSTGTLSADADINTSSYDLKNFLQWRHVDVTTVAVLTDPNLSITNMKWQVSCTDTDNAIRIYEYSASYYFYVG